MNASHIVVAVLTIAAFAWLVWVELRSRRNAAATEQTEPTIVPTGTQARSRKKNR